MYNPFGLQGKIILVTGASSGIGRCVAIECAKMGARVIITGRNEIRLAEVYEKLEGDGHMQIPADLTCYSDLLALTEQLPLLHGCVNNAGIENPKPVQFLKEEDLKQVFDINVEAPIMLTRLLLKKKLLTRGASVVFTSSIAGVHCVAIGSSLYAASKAAIQGFVKGAALDLASKGIRVNSVNPGMITTGLLENMMSPEQLSEDLKYYPLKRLGKPEDVAYAMIYLLSDASCWVTGTGIVVDGGFTLL